LLDKIGATAQNLPVDTYVVSREPVWWLSRRGRKVREEEVMVGNEAKKHVAIAE